MSYFNAMKKEEKNIVKSAKKDDSKVILTMPFDEALKKALNTPLPKKDYKKGGK